MNAEELKLQLSKKYRVIPIDEQKRPAEGIYGFTGPTFDKPDLSGSYGIGIITGKYSDNIEVIDIDLKYDRTNRLFEDYKEMLEAHNCDVIDKVVIQRTMSNGIHLIYKTKDIEGNKKLARRPATPQESEKNEKVKVLIETRGEGGYFASYPTPGYELLQGDLLNIPYITKDERDILMFCATSFNEWVEDESTPTEKVWTGNTPINDYNDRCDFKSLIEGAGWKYVYSKGERDFYKRPGETSAAHSANFNNTMRLFYVFSTSTVFPDGRGLRPAEVYRIINGLPSDYRALKIRLEKEGYGEKTENGDERCEFSDKIETRNGVKWEINHSKFKRWVRDQGIHTLKVSKKDYIIVKIEDGIVRDISKKEFSDIVVDYLDALGADNIYDIYAKNSSMRTGTYVDLIPLIDINFIKDTEDYCYIFFKNETVCINKDDVITVDRLKMDGMIWQDQVIDRQFEQITIDYTCDFKEFLKNVSKYDGELDLGLYDRLRSMIGYLIHTYKDPKKAVAIVINDDNEEDTQSGGRGKSLVVQSIGKIRKLVTVDGMKFDPQDKFCYQSLNLDTQVLLIDDAKKRFPFADLKSVITADLQIEKKGKDAIIVPFKESPKLVLTTNYSIPSREPAIVRRKEEVVLGDHYGIHRSPEDDFENRLFDGWDEEEYNKFDNFMIECVQFYLKNGIVGQGSSEALDRKKLRDATSSEFLEFISIQKIEGRVDKKQLYNDFIAYNPHGTKFLLQNTFTKWCREYFHYRGLEFEEKAINGVYYFIIGDDHQAESQELPF